MEKQGFNPFLPSYEYIPDGEPYVFDGRLYIYGSHDRFGGKIFCLNDYVSWSAPIDNLSDWRYEGLIYKKTQDPKNRLGLHLLFAPDVVKGMDGKYYLYYTLDFYGLMGVAVCDTPAGSYEFYGYVHFADGHNWGSRHGEPLPFDPAVLVDDNGHIYLYSGFSTPIPAIYSRFKKLTSEGGIVLELEPDMLTIKKGPRLLFPKRGKDAFKNHSFFEASSIRKIEDLYYFVYSSEHNHELCYAVSEHPMEGFKFGGTLVSLGDLFLNGNEDERMGVNYLGNTHGGIVNINNQWYVFYHRQTNRHSYSRQACAEPLVMTDAGMFLQTEVTSCGLNGKPLVGMGRYQAFIACNLWSKDGVGRYDCYLPRLRFSKHPYLTQDGKDKDKTSNPYIANMQDESVAGYKYFLISELKEIRIRIRGYAQGQMLISKSSNFDSIIAKIPIRSCFHKKWKEETSFCNVEQGVYALYFKFSGRGSIDFMSFELI